jgi:hypothetical protein
VLVCLTRAKYKFTSVKHDEAVKISLCRPVPENSCVPTAPCLSGFNIFCSKMCLTEIIQECFYIGGSLFVTQFLCLWKTWERREDIVRNKRFNPNTVWFFEKCDCFSSQWTAILVVQDYHNVGSYDHIAISLPAIRAWSQVWILHHTHSLLKEKWSVASNLTNMICLRYIQVYFWIILIGISNFH